MYTNFNDKVNSLKKIFDKKTNNNSIIKYEFIAEISQNWKKLDQTKYIKKWFEKKRKEKKLKVKLIPLKNCKNWTISKTTGNYKHVSGSFFTLEGLRSYNAINREVGKTGWDQPIVKQVGLDGGILGLIRKKINSIPHYLVEAKEEPGNYKTVQLSPTIQATYSNIKQFHKGKKVNFNEYFYQGKKNDVKVIFNQYVSEDGGRFYKKRNIIQLIEIDNNKKLYLPASFKWLTLWEINQLLKANSKVSPHLRSLIAYMMAI